MGEFYKGALNDLNSSGGGTDANAVHVNVASEISGVASKGTPTTNDLLLIEDVADGNNKKKISIGDIPSSSDATAIHVDVANEITGATEKTTVDNQDEFIIEDSGASFVKKSIKRKTIVSPIDNTVSSSATLTPNVDEYEQETITGLSTALTINAPTGTASNGLKLVLRITDDGTNRALTWNAIFQEIGVTLPTTTTANKTIYVGLIYNATATKWDVVAIKEQA